MRINTTIAVILMLIAIVISATKANADEAADIYIRCMNIYDDYTRQIRVNKERCEYVFPHMIVGDYRIDACILRVYADFKEIISSQSPACNEIYHQRGFLPMRDVKPVPFKNKKHNYTYPYGRRLRLP